MPDHVCMDADPDDVELLGGVEKREIVIVDHDPDWAQKFTTERNRIVHALGTRARRVDHIGSTAVPGLPAKPIIDINLSVDDVDDEATYLPSCSPPATSYEYASADTAWSAPQPKTCTYTSAPWAVTGNNGIWCFGTGCEPTPQTETATPR